MTGCKLPDEEDKFIERHIKYIRSMSLLDDFQIRALLKVKVAEDPSIIEKFKQLM